MFLLFDNNRGGPGSKVNVYSRTVLALRTLATDVLSPSRRPESRDVVNERMSADVDCHYRSDYKYRDNVSLKTFERNQMLLLLTSATESTNWIRC